jgi:hypothetical protein
MADPRPTFADNPATNPPTYDEFRNAFFGYYAYWGTYTINEAGHGVVHHVSEGERQVLALLTCSRGQRRPESGSIHSPCPGGRKQRVVSTHRKTAHGLDILSIPDRAS